MAKTIASVIVQEKVSFDTTEIEKALGSDQCIIRLNRAREGWPMQLVTPPPFNVKIDNSSYELAAFIRGNYLHFTCYAKSGAQWMCYDEGASATSKSNTGKVTPTEALKAAEKGMYYFYKKK